jgi:hypothetical protein
LDYGIDDVFSEFVNKRRLLLALRVCCCFGEHLSVGAVHYFYLCMLHFRFLVGERERERADESKAQLHVVEKPLTDEQCISDDRRQFS